MAQHEEPMDVDSSVCDFDNKENTSILTNVLPRTPCTEKGYEELDVTELNMKLRYSLSPNMSKSYTASSDRNFESVDGLNTDNNLTRSYNANNPVTKTLRSMPLQALPSESLGDGNRSALRPLDATNTLDNACIISRNDDDLSLPSSSSSMAQTPESITPTTEMLKPDGSPIMRGLKSVFNMFRPSPSPIPTDHPSPIDIEKPETMSPPVIHSPETSASKPQHVLASTPLAAYKTKDVLRRKSPNRESVVFNDDLEKDLQWNDETTVIFSHEKIPLHKLLFPTKPDSVQKKSIAVTEIPKEEENLDSTVEYMDISYNDSVVKDKTITEDDLLKKDIVAIESDSEFVDCESTFTKNDSFIDLNDTSKPDIKQEDVENKEELNNTITEENEELEINAEDESTATEGSINESEGKLVIDGPVSIENQETKVDNLIAQPEATRLEDNGNVIDINPIPHIDNNVKIIESPVSPPLENVVSSTLTQIPLIADPRVLLFNLSQNLDSNDKINAAEIPLPDDNDEHIKSDNNQNTEAAENTVNVTESNKMMSADEIPTKIPKYDDSNKTVDKENILEVICAKELLEMDSTFDISQFIKDEANKDVFQDTINPEAKVTFEADKLNNQSNHNDTLAIVDEISALETELENKSNLSGSINKSALEKSKLISEQKSETRETNISNPEQNYEGNKSDSFVISNIDTTTVIEGLPKVVSSEDTIGDYILESSPIPQKEPENIPQDTSTTFEEPPKVFSSDGIVLDNIVESSPILPKEAQNILQTISNLNAITTIEEPPKLVSTEDIILDNIVESSPIPQKELENVPQENIDVNTDTVNEEQPNPINNEESASKLEVKELTAAVKISTVTKEVGKNSTNAEGIIESNFDIMEPITVEAESTPVSEDPNIQPKAESIIEKSCQEAKLVINQDSMNVDVTADVSKEIIIIDEINQNATKETFENIISEPEISAVEMNTSSATPVEHFNAQAQIETAAAITNNVENNIEAQISSENDAITISTVADEKKELADKIEELEVKSNVPEVITEIAVKDEEIVTSKGSSPFVSVSVDLNEIPVTRIPETDENIANPFASKANIASTPPTSPPIASKGYNFNFDEIEDPFATRTSIRMSPPPAASPNKTFESAKPTVQKKDFNKNRRKSQPERKKPVTNNKKMNSTFTGGSVEPHKINNKHSKPTPSPDKTFEKEGARVACEDTIESALATANYIVNKVTATSNPDKMSIDPIDFNSEKLLHTFVEEEKMSVDADILSCKKVTALNDEKMSIQFEPTPDNVNKEFITPSSSEQSTYFSADTTSNESVEPKSVFNLPEIDDTNFNRFATVTKTKHSPTSSGKDAFNSSALKEAQNNTFDITSPVQVPEDLNIPKAKENIEDIEIMTNTSGDTCSSKDDEEKNNTVQEVHTEDEDTVEGPFIEAHLKDDKMKGFVTTRKSDMMSFDLPAHTNDDNADGELFIDADAFEFLLNQNKDNTVADSGKESLFLKFDPLFAKRMSSDGVVAALNNLQTRQSTPQKTKREDQTAQKAPNAGSSKLNVTQEIEANSTENSIDELNITVAKPMMVVNPAVNAIVTPRNKTMSPVGSNRRSLTFTSPAIAVIDRLLSMSANNSLLHDATVGEVNREQSEADVALTQLRELLADKEISVYNLRSETKELKDRLSTLETQMNFLETISEARLKNINELTEKLDEKTKLNKRMAAVVEEYERTIASLIAETEEDKRRHAEERLQLIQERDEQSAHLASMEVSFSDLHSKYEKSKQMILGFKNSEDIYKKAIKDFEESLAKMQANYESLKQHATSKLNHANEELQKMNKAHEAEMLKLNAMIKRKELHITSLEETLLQKTKANEELTAICDELINKVG